MKYVLFMTERRYKEAPIITPCGIVESEEEAKEWFQKAIKHTDAIEYEVDANVVFLFHELPERPCVRYFGVFEDEDKNGDYRTIPISIKCKALKQLGELK